MGKMAMFTILHGDFTAERIPEYPPPLSLLLLTYVHAVPDCIFRLVAVALSTWGVIHAESIFRHPDDHADDPAVDHSPLSHHLQMSG